MHQPRRIAECGEVTPGDHQRFLHRILGTVDVTDDPLGDAEQPVTSDADQVGIRVPFSAARGVHQLVRHPRPLVALVGSAVHSVMGRRGVRAFNLRAAVRGALGQAIVRPWATPMGRAARWRR
jgi:hypothetical protein